MKFLRCFAAIFLLSALLFCKKPTNETPPLSSGEFSLLWNDDFTTLSSSRWAAANWSFNRNLCEFSPAMVKMADGVLGLGIQKKGAEKGRHPEKPYWGAEIYTHARFGYGKFEAVMKPVCPPGVVVSFFLMQIENDIDGREVDWYEIDIEFPGSSRQVSYALHWGEKGVLKSTSQVVDLPFDAAEDFHTYAIIWKPEAIVFTIDGEQTAEFSDAKIMAELNQPMTVRMNYWVSESADWVGRFYPSVLPLETYYRSVACYRYNPQNVDEK